MKSLTSLATAFFTAALMSAPAIAQEQKIYLLRDDVADADVRDLLCRIEEGQIGLLEGFCTHLEKIEVSAGENINRCNTTYFDRTNELIQTYREETDPDVVSYQDRLKAFENERTLCYNEAHHEEQEDIFEAFDREIRDGLVLSLSLE